MDFTIGQFASRQVHAVEAHTSMMAAIRLMSEQHISCVVVLEQGEPVGILTERDVVFAANWVLGQPDLLVREVMNKPVLTAPEELLISKAYEIFREYSIRHLVVLDDRLDLGGIFTQTDLVRALRKTAFAGYADISALMSPKVLHVKPDVPARYALSQMARRAVSCVVVVDEGRTVGVFTERDVVRLITDGVDLTQVTVGNVMSVSLVTASMSMSPFSAIGLMQQRAVRHLVVLDELGDLVGVLTQTDLGRALDSAGRMVQPVYPSPLLSGTGSVQPA